MTSASTLESRTIGVMPWSPDPESATPSAQATSSAAAPLSTAPPTASRARIGCHLILSRIRVPTSWKSACPREAQTITMKIAASDTRIDGVASPSAWGASQTPARPPSSSPVVAKAPVTNPCQ